MNARSALFLFLSITLLFLVSLALPFRGASAAPDGQFVTATPGPDGRITYVVVEGDSCLQVALLHGITSHRHSNAGERDYRGLCAFVRR
jgi:hypothetical protein